MRNRWNQFSLSRHDEVPRWAIPAAIFFPCPPARSAMGGSPVAEPLALIFGYGEIAAAAIEPANKRLGKILRPQNDVRPS